LAGAYFGALAPLMAAAQRTLGDYVPAGELFPALGSALGPCFVANVLLAPFVEESLYRDYALTVLGQRFRPGAAILLSCLFLGLLPWTGGFWYVPLTGLVAGGAFAALVAWRGNRVAAFAAHLALNAAEFGVIAWRMGPLA
jgi:membrane protease YdiL (CAAX protease family)